jgi:hypothetical protein
MFGDIKAECAVHSGKVVNGVELVMIPPMSNPQRLTAPPPTQPAWNNPPMARDLKGPQLARGVAESTAVP